MFTDPLQMDSHKPFLLGSLTTKSKSIDIHSVERVPAISMSHTDLADRIVTAVWNVRSRFAVEQLMKKAGKIQVRVGK